MIVKIQLGIGSQGKLWTGSKVDSDLSGKYARVDLVYFRSSKEGSVASTKRLFIREVMDRAPEGLFVPILHISLGGVGSIVAPSESTLDNITTWNWSGRVGGYVILNPVAVESGYINPNNLNKPLDGYKWICTYSGETLSEYILIKVDENGYPVQEHLLPIGERRMLSPPERREEEEKETPLEEDNNF